MYYCIGDRMNGFIFQVNKHTIKEQNTFIFENENGLLKMETNKDIFLQMNLTISNDICIQYNENDTRIVSDNITLSIELMKDNYIIIKPCNKNVTKIEISNFKINAIPKKEKINIEYIFVINLKKDYMRRKKISKLFEKYNITNFEFFDAINGNDYEKEYNEVKKNGSKIKSIGHYGCLKSHLQVLKISKNRKYKNILILEDDIFFNENIIQKIQNIEIPYTDIIYLGGISKYVKMFYDEYAYAKHIYGCFGYLVKNTCFDKIIKLYETKENCIDIMLSHLQYQNNYVVLNNYVLTNIENTNTSKKTNNYMEYCKKIHKEFHKLDLIKYENFLNYSSIKNLFDMNIHDLTEYNLCIDDFYFFADEKYENELDNTKPWLFNNGIICNELINVIKNAQNIFHKSQYTYNIFCRVLKNSNNKLIEYEKKNAIIKTGSKIYIGYHYDDFMEKQLHNIINKYKNYKNKKIIYTQNIEECNLYICLAHYDIVFHECINFENIKILCFNNACFEYKINNCYKIDYSKKYDTKYIEEIYLKFLEENII
jgi:GR25 family glycosyltransferase involved in LPS biosynthesis